MYTFHASVHRRPDSSVAGEAGRDGGESPLMIAVNSQVPFSVTFDEVAERLNELPRMFCEPDGSFVWVDESSERNWQVDGILFDGQGQLAYVELKGCCPEARFNQLLAVLGWPDTPVMFQLVRQGLYLSEESFRDDALHHHG